MQKQRDKMNWQTWTKISGAILFIIAITGFYLSNFYQEGAVLEIQNLPSSSNLERLKVSEDYTFTFSLYNIGDKTAFVDIISVNTDPALVTELSPSSLSIEEKQTKDIQVTLTAPGRETETAITITVFYGEEKAISKTLQAEWKS